MSDTATIRVPRETRNTLSDLADAHGLSISKLLTEMAAREHRHLAFASERAARVADQANPLALAEYSLWDEAELDEIV